MNTTSGPGTFIGSMLWANRPTPSAALAGVVAFFTDLGANGSFMQATSTRWRALNGRAVLKDLGDPVASIANSNTIVLQALIPIGAWQTNDEIWVDGLSLTKSGTTDSLSASWYVGTAGTTSDTAIFSGNGLIAAANRTLWSSLAMKLVSATSAQKFGQGGSVYGTQGGAESAAVTITSAAANALYVSFAIQSSGASNTVGIQGGQIVLRTP